MEIKKELFNVATQKYTKEDITKKYNEGKNMSFLFFWKTSKQNLDKGCFSQWQESYFTVENVDYFCTEQFMMAYKADLFNDLDALEKILNSNHPKEIKKLGRTIKNFNESIWNENKYSIVLTGNYHKFNQNTAMKNILLETQNKIIVEASPYDKIWGVALSESDKTINNPNNWKGENLLGFSLMEVRDMLS